MIIADSSFLVAFFDETDNQHKKAVEDMKRIEGENIDIMVNEHVLGETATVLLYHNGIEAAKIFLLYAKENFEIDTIDGEYRYATIEIFINQNKKLSYIDASVVHLARFLQLPIACYDENILKEIKR